MILDFDKFNYFPSIRSRQWELRGYNELAPPEKKKLAPVFVLATHGRTKSVGDLCGKIAEATDGNPYILDIESSPIYACDEYNQLASPDDSFQNWCNFISEQDRIVPTAILHKSAPQRAIVRQVLKLETLKGQVVVRSRNPVSDVNLLISIISAVDSVHNLMIILDFGYIRGQLPTYITEAADVINELRKADETIRLVVMASSYPKSVATYSDVGTTLEIEERGLHLALGGDSVAIYGDHASIHPEPFEPMQTRFVPRIDFALPDAWIFRRVRTDAGGFEACAQQITALTDWDPHFAEQCWGAEKISNASLGDLTSMNAPAPWIAARVNMHLQRQINYASDTSDDFEDLL